MTESSESQNLVCENDILIVNVVSDKGELTYVDWSDAIKEYLKDVCLWDIVEDASAENNEVAELEIMKLQELMIVKLPGLKIGILS